MKPSPLRLNYVVYPALSFEATPEYTPEGSNALVPSNITAVVRFRKNGSHLATLLLKQENEGNEFPYKFSIDVFAGFSFDKDLARATYPVRSLPAFVAVNVVRVLFAGAREFLAVATSRAPFDALRLESQLIEPSDVQIFFDKEEDDEDDMASLVATIFGDGVELEDVAETPKPARAKAKS